MGAVVGVSYWRYFAGLIFPEARVSVIPSVVMVVE